MAYIPKQLSEDEQNQFGRTAPTTPFPQAQGGGSAGAGENPAGAAPGVGTSTQFGSNAAKLSDYLNANKEQVGEFGQKVAGDLSNRYNQTVSAIDQGTGDFNQQVGANYTPPDSSKVNQALQDPAAFAKDQKNVQDFQTWYNPTYTGPQNFEGTSTYSNLNDQVNKAVEKSSLVKTPAGLSTYLSDFGGNNYSTGGMRTLDSALLQRDPGARTAIASAATPYSNLTGYLGDKTKGANAAIESKKGEIASSGENVRNQTQSSIDAFNQDIQNRLQSGRSRESQEAQFEQDILSHGLSNDSGQFVKTSDIASPYDEAQIQTTLKDLGLTREQLGTLLNNRYEAERGLMNPTPSQGYVVNPTNENILNYLTVSPSENMGVQNVASADDYARAQALSALSNNPSVALPGAAAAPFNSVNFNQNALKTYQDIADEIKRQRLGLPSAPPPITNPVGVGGGGAGVY